MTPFTLPGRFVANITEVFGEAGARWLEGLTALVVECERRWSLRVLPPFGSLSYNYVAPAVGFGGAEVVLKLGLPGPELYAEMEALRLYDGRGTVRLLEADRELGAMLLERLRPGTPLVHLENDEEATAIAAGVMRRMLRPVPQGHSLPAVAHWAGQLGRIRLHHGGGTGHLPERMVRLAESLFDELTGSMSEPVLLHGDLHHENILYAGRRRGWVAIDPKGVVGEPEFEVGALLRDPMPDILSWPRLDRILARRLDILAEELGFNRERMLKWATAQAVLAGSWDLEDHGGGWEKWFAVAESLEGLLGAGS